MSGKYLAIAYSTDQAVILGRYIRKVKNSNVIAISLDPEADKEFARNLISYKTAKDYLSEKSIHDIDEAAFSLAKSWHRLSDIEPLVTYNGLSLGCLAEYDLSLYFVSLLKIIEASSMAIENEKPDKIIAVDDTDSSKITSILLAGLYKIPIEIIKPHRSKQLAHRFFRNTFVINVRVAGIPLKLRVPRFIFNFSIAAVNCFEKASIAIQMLGRKSVSTERKRTKILMINFKITEYQCLLKELSNNHHNDIFILNSLKPISWDRGAIKTLVNMGLKYKLLSDYSNKEINGKLGRARIWLSDNWSILKENKCLKQALTYRNVPLWTLVEGQFHFLFTSYFLDLIEYLECLTSIINEEKIDAVVCWNDVLKFEKTIALLCKNMNVPTVVVQHGVTGHPIGYVPLSSDRMAVWGESSKNWLVNQGVDSNKLIITGNPKFDELHLSCQGQNDVFQELKLSPGKGFFVYATQPLVAGFLSRDTAMASELAFRALLKAMEQFPEKQLVVKLHPIDDGKLITTIVQGLKRKISVTITKNVNLYNLLRISDLLITIDSTVALEAMLLNKPVLILNLDKRPNIYTENGIAAVVREPDEIIPMIRTVMARMEDNSIIQARNKFVYDYAYLQDGQASKRVYALLEQMINRAG